jgi:hypothetical protein
MKTTWKAMILGAGAAISLGGCISESGELGDLGDPGDELARGEVAFPGEHGEVRTGMLDTPDGPREMTYELLHGWAVVEGDLLFDPPGGERGATRATGTARWPGGVIPYTIDPALPSQSRVTDAIAQWEAQTGITFVAHGVQTDYVTFRPSTGCSSSLGRIGGQQFINLAAGCSTGAVIHEIGHLVGMRHEQTRADRDNHVIVNLANVEPGKEGNFNKFTTDGRDVGAYELLSIMHYPPYNFSVNGLPTITLLDGSTYATQRVALTDTDIIAVNKIMGWGQASDINGDGYGDVVVGVPNEDINVADAGAIQVFFSNSSGLTDTDAWLHRDAVSVEDTAVANDHFGSAVATGDFDADGLADAVVGVPDDDVGGFANIGSIQVFYGTVLGLGVADDAVFSQASVPGIVLSANDRLGSVLAVGDFNGDGYDDIAAGAPDNDIGAIVDAGSVLVLYGSATGITATGASLWTQNTGTIQDVSLANERFGAALAAGDFDGDGFDELAIGVPNQTIGGDANAGAVHVLFGSITGVTDAGNQFWHEDAGLPGVAEVDDYFGFALAAGDFDSDGRRDLAIGAPLEDLAGGVDAGQVTVMYGSAGGVTAGGSQLWNQDSAAVQEVAEVSDTFGRALEAGDFNGDGYTDLMVASPFEDVGAVNSAGALQLLQGSATGITSTLNQLFTEASGGFGVATASNTFAYRIRAADFTGDGIADLVVGIDSAAVGGQADAGALHEYQGSVLGLAPLGPRWSQDSANVQDTAEVGDHFALGL